MQTEELRTTLFGIRNSTADFGRVGVSFNKETLRAGDNPLEEIGIDLPPGEYSFDRYEVFFNSAEFRRLSFEFFYGDGDYFNGERLTLNGEMGWNVNRHVAFALAYDYNKYDFPSADAITRQITFNNEIAFNSNWSILTLAQYDNLSDDIGINMRLRYNRKAGQDFWLVLNHNLREFDRTDPEYRGSGFRSVETVAAVKVRYTLRF